MIKAIVTILLLCNAFTMWALCKVASDCDDKGHGKTVSVKWVK